MRPPNDVITAPIPRAELVGLLDSMTPIEQQRVTAQISVVVHDDVAQIVDVPHSEGSSLDLVVRFTKPSLAIYPLVEPDTRPLPRWAIVIGSCVVIVLLGLLVMAAA